MTEREKHCPEFCVAAQRPCPYLPGRQERKLFTHLTNEKPTTLIDNLLRGGFRRSQNIAYMPYCEGCHACISVRVVVDEFKAGRSMRRVTEKNRAITATRRPPEPTSEQFALFRRYIDARHADGGMADMTVLDYAMMVEDSVINTFVTEYRARPDDALDTGTDAWPLVGAALCDMLSDGISMVYSFNDPEAENPRPGTYMILEHIEYARRLGLPYLYLGYWITGSRKMAYKMRFTPQELLGPNGWVRKD